MSGEFRFTNHALERLSSISEIDRTQLLKELDQLIEGNFSKLKFYLNSRQFKNDENTYIMRLKNNVRIVYSEVTDETGNTVYLINTVYKKISDKQE